jgi:hypothetical protein
MKQNYFSETSSDRKRYARIPKLSSLSKVPVLHEAAFRAKMSLENWPWLSIALRRQMHARHPSVSKYVTKGHKLVIDGYPRSGNSYSRLQFLEANPGIEPHFGNHIHLASQLILAVRYELPAALLLRKPEEAVVSYGAFRIKQAMSGAMTIEALLEQNCRYYYDMHRRLLPYRDRILVSRFEDVITDYAGVIDRLNCKFGCSFELPDCSKSKNERIIDEAPEHLTPSTKRNQLKKEIESYIHKNCLSAELKKCKQVYDALLD